MLNVNDLRISVWNFPVCRQLQGFTNVVLPNPVLGAVHVGTLHDPNFLLSVHVPCGLHVHPAVL